jgi:hypothetical protein
MDSLAIAAWAAFRHFNCFVDEVVSLVGPLEEAADALRSWSENPASFKKIMVSID